MSGNEVSMADLMVAQNVAVKVDHLIKESFLLATSVGTSITVPQLAAALLTATWEQSERTLTREEWGEIYDYVSENMTAYCSALAASTSPADTATAATPEEARALADIWGQRIEDVAFEIPGFLTEAAEDPTDG